MCATKSTGPVSPVNLDAVDLDAVDLEIDTCGLNCPLPILRTKKALATLQSGQVLKVHTTDPAAAQDFPLFAKQTGHVLLHTEQTTTGLVFYLQHRPSKPS